MAIFHINRRLFLSGLGGVGLALPFLPSLEKKARGEIPGVPVSRRFISIFTGNGQRASYWFPQQNPPMSPLNPDGKLGFLSDIPGPMSHVLNTEFDSLRSKLNLVRGLDIIPVAAPHWGGKMMSGFGILQEKHVTIDQVMAGSDSVYKTLPRVRSLNVKIPGNAGVNNMLVMPTSYAKVNGSVVAVVPSSDPKNIFFQLFRGMSLPEQKWSIPDSVKLEFSSLLANKRLSTEDKRRLDAHMTFVADLERRLNGRHSSECRIPTEPGEINPDAIDYQQTTRDLFDLIIATIKCGLTNVVGMCLTEPSDENSFRFLPGVTIPNFHRLSHEVDQGSWDELKIIYQWQGRMVAEFLNKLDTIEDPTTGKTYLDNSVVYWGNEQSSKYNDVGIANGHASLDMPVLLAGSCGGMLKTGQFIDYRSDTVRRRISSTDCNAGPCQYDENYSNRGRPLNQLLISLMLAMGLKPVEWEEGGPGFGDYSGDPLQQYDFGDKRSGLAEIMV